MKNIIQKLAILSIVASSASGAVLINGSFEAPEAGSGIISITPGSEPGGFGWTVLSGDIEVQSESYFNLPGPAFDGNQFMDLNGASQSGIAQVFTTVIGGNYSLTFAYASNYSHHGPGNPALATFSLTDEGSGANFFAPQVISHGSSSSTNLDWRVQTVDFVATGSSTRLSFVSNSPETPFGGILLDGVSIVPEPGTTALFGVGVLTILRRRRGDTLQVAH
jgi:hypothetical protein